MHPIATMQIRQILRKDVLVIVIVLNVVIVIQILHSNKSHFDWHKYNISPDTVSTEVVEIKSETVSTQKLDTATLTCEDSSVLLKLQESVKNASETLTLLLEVFSDYPKSKLKMLLIKRTQEHRKILKEHGMTLPSTDGVGKRVIIVTTWRSGSTFTAEVLGALPGVFYHYEPLMYKRFEDLQSNATLAQQGIDTIANLLNCIYAPLQDYLNYFPTDKNLLDRNTYFEEICKLTNRSLCYQPDTLSFGCRHFPLQITKSVRLPLKAFLQFLRNPELNLHVLLLVRDPRGTIASRKRMSWCKDDCLDPKRLCSLLQENYEMAVQAAQEFPGSFTVLRYEDLALNPNNVSAWLFQNLKLPQTPSVKDYITKHTTAEVDLPWTTTRKLGSRVELWKKDLAWEDIEAVQEACGDTLTNYGYAPVPTSDLLNDTISVLPDWNLSIPASDNTVQ